MVVNMRPAEIDRPLPARPVIHTGVGPAGQRPWPVSEATLRGVLRLLERIDGDEWHGQASTATDLERADRLRAHLASIAVACDPKIAAVGRRITVGTEHNASRTWWLALPGDESATADTISVSSAMGRALAWAAVGDTVYLAGEDRGWAIVLEVCGPR